MSKYFLNLTLCPQCNNYPLLSLSKAKPKDILIQCDKCGYNQYTSLQNYLSQIKNISEVINNKYCSEHNQSLNRNMKIIFMSLMW